MGLFGGPKKKLRDLEASILASSSIYGMYESLPPEVKARVATNLGDSTSDAYRGAVAAGAKSEADALIVKYRARVPSATPAPFPDWGVFLDKIVS